MIEKEKYKQTLKWNIRRGNGIKLFEGYIDIGNNSIEKFSDNLKINGNLTFNNVRNEIKELPNNLTVTGFLDLEGTQIKKIGNGLRVGGHLYLKNTKIQELPDNLEVGESLYLEGNTLIKKLPNNLKIGKNLYLQCTLISELPQDLRINGYISIDSTITKNIPHHLKNKIINHYGSCCSQAIYEICSSDHI